MRERSTVSVRSHWQGAVLVCGKCTRKVGGGFGAERRVSLVKALRRALGLKKGRKAPLGVVETRCLGLCPRAAVVVVPPQPGRDWLVVPAGSEVDEVAVALGLERTSNI